VKPDDAWKGFTVVCLASGPSLTPEDVEKVREWRCTATGRAVIVCNTTFRLAPWADALMAFDARWWRFYLKEVEEGFKGERFANTYAASAYGAHRLMAPFNGFGNSGASAVALALWRGAERVLMLGYDCSLGPNGETHHHGSHPANLSDAETLKKWPVRFAKLAELADGRAVNCSRVTALKCFPRARLEDVLC
jgi:hypothetical protein